MRTAKNLRILGMILLPGICSALLAQSSSPAAPAPASSTTAATEKIPERLPGLDPRLIEASANPCDNFYRYACGNFAKLYSIPNVHRGDARRIADGVAELADNITMRILVIGAGAVGGYFGGRLHEAGRDVSFLVRARQAETISAYGLRIVSPYGDAILHPRLILANEIAGSYDLILLSVKAYSLQGAMNDFAVAVGPSTMILPVLNGMRHIDLLTGQFGEDAVIGGVCLIVAEVDRDNRIVQMTKMHRLVYGERRGGSSARITALDETLQGVGFEARTSENIIQEMWEKWVLLSSLGATTCLLRGNIGEIEAIPGGAELALEILAECSAISAACGYAPGEAFFTRTQQTLNARGSTLTSSMYRDLTRNARVEVDQILGDLLERGRRLGVAAPLLAAACANLRIYQARLESAQ